MNLKLNKKDSIQLLNSLYRPNKEDMNKQKELRNRLNYIEITDIENGFVAEVEGLDLSMLDDKEKYNEQ